MYKISGNDIFTILSEEECKTHSVNLAGILFSTCKEIDKEFQKANYSTNYTFLWNGVKEHYSPILNKKIYKYFSDNNIKINAFAVYTMIKNIFSSNADFEYLAKKIYEILSYNIDKSSMSYRFFYKLSEYISNEEDKISEIALALTGVLYPLTKKFEQETMAVNDSKWAKIWEHYNRKISVIIDNFFKQLGAKWVPLKNCFGLAQEILLNPGDDFESVMSSIKYKLRQYHDRGEFL